jgi:GTP-binding protein
MNYRTDLRNIAIIAHVDHGKTTLVDGLLKQSHVFRDNQATVDCIMDMNTLERERGITILAKNTAVTYKGVKINIIDTPGHADFGGEVERVINMANGCLLLVDAVDGPMPQTKVVLRRALEKKLKPIVIINKIDRENARIPEVLNMVQDLFLELATSDEQLDFPVIYASGREGWATLDPKVKGTSLEPLFETILKEVPPPVIEEGPFQMLVSNLDFDTHKGKIAIGRIWRGKVSPHNQLVVMNDDGTNTPFEAKEVFTHLGLKRVPVEEAAAGDIIAITGMEKTTIGDTLASSEQPEALPRIEVTEPTVKMTFGVNTSPFSGREGKYSTTRQLRERLYRELETNLSLRVNDTDSSDTFLVSGRGELHLSVLIETMRREGYEFEVSKPEAIVKEVNGKLMEPVEDLTLDIRDQFIGGITELLSSRQAQMTNMHNDGRGNIRMEYRIPTKGLIGFRSAFLTATKGEGVLNSIFIGYEPLTGDIASTRSGSVMVASDAGEAAPYGLNVAQQRGIPYIDAGTMVYEGMIVGQTNRPRDFSVNVCKTKKLTNIRSSTGDIAVKLIPPIKMSLEQAIDYINKDELVEVTPKGIRLRKKVMKETMRLRAAAAGRRGPDDDDDDE